jgi:hypothetical protein
MRSLNIKVSFGLNTPGCPDPLLSLFPVFFYCNQPFIYVDAIGQPKQTMYLFPPRIRIHVGWMGEGVWREDGGKMGRGWREN